MSEVQYPTCYRHPDRVTWVTCQRCNRDICPECQTPAAVGFQCPECVKAGKQQVRRPSKARAARAWMASASKPTVTYVIIALNVFVFLGQQVVPGLTNELVFYPAAAYTEPWRMLTAAFAHGGFLHILLNMYTLWIFGQGLEPAIGKVRYLALYVVSAIGGSVGVLWMASPNSAVLGASGAIFGLMGAFFVIQRRLGGQATQMFILIALNLVFGFLNPGVSWQAHVGGLVAGLVMGTIVFSTRQQARLTRFWLLTAGFVVVMSGLVWLRYPLLLAAYSA